MAARLAGRSVLLWRRRGSWCEPLDEVAACAAEKKSRKEGCEHRQPVNREHRSAKSNCRLHFHLLDFVQSALGLSCCRYAIRLGQSSNEIQGTFRLGDRVNGANG